MPQWPQGVTTFGDANYQAINAATKYPQLATELLWYVGAARPFWYGLMHLSGQGPGVVSYWPDYVGILTQVAPPLRAKRVDVYPQMVAANAPVPARDFPVHPSQSIAIAEKWLGQISAKKVSIHEGLAQATAQINALQAAGVPAG